MIKITLKRKENKVSMECEGNIPEIHFRTTNKVWGSGKNILPRVFYEIGVIIWFGCGGIHSCTFNTKKQALESMQRTTEAAKDMITKAGKIPRVRRFRM